MKARRTHCQPLHRLRDLKPIPLRQPEMIQPREATEFFWGLFLTILALYPLWLVAGWMEGR